ncbi:MAG: hypothetical protein JXR91_15890 [Deltaproteobacteria bacterium]|nr:hypothetical protein [Deltaproteobacteria bacterium]
MIHPVKINELSQGVKRIIEQDGPAPAKMMAASGMAPLPPAELITALYYLSYDGDNGISQKAQKTLLELPDNILLSTVSGDIFPEVLDGIVTFLVKREKVIEKIILNKRTPDETFIKLAETLKSEKLLEIIIANEQRLLRTPVIIEKLYFNKYTRMSSVDRAVELAIRNHIELTGIPAFDEAKKALEGELIFEADEEPTPDDLNFNNAVEHAEILAEAPVDEVNDVLDALESGAADDNKSDIDENSEKKVVNLATSLTTMTVSQKIRMAMLGSASQRSVLIRDSNKLVIMSVLKSPSVNDAEIRRYSSLKGLPEEAMRYISCKRDWTKQYTVKLNLVNNPRTPIEYAIRFLNYLRPNDVRALERSKDVPGVISKAAKELRKKRTK